MSLDPYPTDAELAEIEKWPMESGYNGLLDTVRGLWWPNDEGTQPVDGQVAFCTGGWSGNESLIGALRANMAYWAICWESSNRGGKHVFEVPEHLQHKKDAGQLAGTGQVAKFIDHVHHRGYPEIAAQSLHDNNIVLGQPILESSLKRARSEYDRSVNKQVAESLTAEQD